MTYYVWINSDLILSLISYDLKWRTWITRISWALYTSVAFTGTCIATVFCWERLPLGVLLPSIVTVHGTSYQRTYSIAIRLTGAPITVHLETLSNFVLFAICSAGLNEDICIRYTFSFSSLNVHTCTQAVGVQFWKLIY